MEGGMKKDNSNEFQLLLGEIPIAVKPNNNSPSQIILSHPYSGAAKSRTDLKEKFQKQDRETTLPNESSLAYAFSRLNFGNGGVGFESLDYSSTPLRAGLGNPSSSVGFESSDGWASPANCHRGYHQKFESINVQPYTSSRSFTAQKEEYYKAQQDCMYLQQLYHQRVQACKQVQLTFEDNYHHAHSVFSRRKQQFVEKLPSTSHGYPDLRSLDGYPYSSMHNQTGVAWSNYDDNSGFSPVIPTSIYSMTKDQHGCRHLQKTIAEGNPEDIRMIFNEILGHIVELMTHPFGNYMIQKLLEVCNEDQLTQILYVITRNNADLLRISCDMHGTRAIQKIVQTVRTHEQVSMLVYSLRLGIVTLAKNMNGNHVAQRCLTYLAAEHNEFIFEAATNHCLDLATDCHGCCVLQRCLTHSNVDQKRRLIKAITFNALLLSQNIYGNYVVQCILDLNVSWATMEILDRLAGAYWDLSIQKCSSNVIEKCLEFGGDEGRGRIVKELLNDHRFDQIMHDPFGNYVIQAALKFSMGPLHEELLEAIRPHYHELQTSPYGKKVLSGKKHKRYQSGFC